MAACLYDNKEVIHQLCMDNADVRFVSKEKVGWGGELILGFCFCCFITFQFYWLCFVVIKPCVLSANRVDLDYFFVS